jgi:hypothetical protein
MWRRIMIPTRILSACTDIGSPISTEILRICKLLSCLVEYYPAGYPRMDNNPLNNEVISDASSSGCEEQTVLS